MFERLSPSTEEEWHGLRQRVLTATEVSVILGLNKWKSVKELLESKKNRVAINNAYTWMGQVLEPIVVDATNEVLGSDFRLYEGRAFFVDQKLGLGATPDAHDDERLLECKSTKPTNYFYWSFWPPAYYLAQLYTQLYCTGKKEGYLAIMSTNLAQYSPDLKLPIHVHQLLRSDKIDAILIEEVKRFWECQEKGKMFRVNRKRALYLELLFRFNTRSLK